MTTKPIAKFRETDLSPPTADRGECAAQEIRSESLRGFADRLALRARLAGMPPDAVFGTDEAAAYCGMGVSTWERKRMGGETPVAIRLTARTLGYRKRTLDAWLDSRTEHRAA